MKKIKFYNSIRFRLTLFTSLLIMLPLGLIFLYYTSQVERIFMEKYSSSEMSSVYETAQKIDYILSDIEEFSNGIVSNRRLLDLLSANETDFDQSELDSILRDIYASRDDIEGISIDYNYKNYFIGIEKIHSKDGVVDKLVEEHKGEAFWIPTKEYVIKIFSGEFIKEYYTYMRSIIDFNTLENYGLLYIDIAERNLYDEYKSLEAEEGTEAFICDSNGRILSSGYKTKIGTYMNYNEYGKQILSSEEDQGYKDFEKDGKDMVAFYSRIPSNDWILIKTIPSDNLFAKVNDLQDKLIIGAVLYLLLSFVFLGFIMVRFTNPMSSIMRDLRKVEKGDLSIRTSVKGEDEIGHLGNSVNNMIAEMDNLIQRLITEEQEKNQVELEVLHAQINPHFLYNTLNTIKWMAKIQGADTVSNAITALIKLLRVSITFGKDMIKLEEEIDYVKNYVIIQKLRFNDSFDIEYKVQEGCNKYKVPKLILQPIVENAIIYGADEIDNLTIDINAYQQDDKLIIEVSDNGPGIKDEVLKDILEVKKEKGKFSKVGLNNVEQRIKLYYGREYGLSITTEEGLGTKVIVTLLAKVK